MMPNLRKPIATGYHLDFTRIPTSELRKMSMFTFRKPNGRLTGNTMYPNDVVFAAFLDEGMIEQRTAKVLCYAKAERAASSMANRLRCVEKETKNIYKNYRYFKAGEKITKSLRWILDPERRRMKTGSQQYGRNRINYSKRLCEEIVAYWGGVGRAVDKTRIPLSTLGFWLVYETE